MTRLTSGSHPRSSTVWALNFPSWKTWYLHLIQWTTNLNICYLWLAQSEHYFDVLALNSLVLLYVEEGAEGEQRCAHDGGGYYLELNGGINYSETHICKREVYFLKITSRNLLPNFSTMKTATILPRNWASDTRKPLKPTFQEQLKNFPLWNESTVFRLDMPGSMSDPASSKMTCVWKALKILCRNASLWKCATNLYVKVDNIYPSKLLHKHDHQDEEEGQDVDALGEKVRDGDASYPEVLLVGKLKRFQLLRGVEIRAPEELQSFGCFLCKTCVQIRCPKDKLCLCHLVFSSGD